MRNNRTHVLMLATSHRTRGGVTAVLDRYRQCPFWSAYRVDWLETHIDKGKGLKLWYAARAFSRYLWIVNRYDIIHVHTSELPSVKRKLPFIWLAKWLGKKVVVHLHIGNQLAACKENHYYKTLFRKADAVVVLSQSIRRMVVDWFEPGGEVWVIYNPCLPIVPAVYEESRRTILFAGTLNANKDYATVIRAFARVAGRYPAWRLILAGNGEVERARALARELGVEPRVLFPGWVRGEEKDALFRNAGLFCLASHAEGFPMAVLDAWAYGLPVVTTPVGGLPDVLRADENALIFEPGDVAGLAERFERALSDGSLRSRLAAESLKLAGGPFSLATANREIEELYQSLYQK